MGESGGLVWVQVEVWCGVKEEVWCGARGGLVWGKRRFGVE